MPNRMSSCVSCMILCTISSSVNSSSSGRKEDFFWLQIGSRPMSRVILSFSSASLIVPPPAALGNTFVCLSWLTRSMRDASGSWSVEAAFVSFSFSFRWGNAWVGISSPGGAINTSSSATCVRCALGSVERKCEEKKFGGEIGGGATKHCSFTWIGWAVEYQERQLSGAATVFIDLSKDGSLQFQRVRFSCAIV